MQPGRRAGAHVTIEFGDAPGPLVLDVAATGDRYTVERGSPGPHPLLEAALEAHPLPGGRAAIVHVSAEVPPGSSMGTSASVIVALIAASRAANDEAPDPATVAAAAYAVETGLGLQTGVQDQYAAAFGGCNLFKVDDYPTVTVEPIVLFPSIAAALDARCVTVYLGQPHRSTQVHDRVIATLRDERDAGARLEPLRTAAVAAAAALATGDLDAYGAALRANTEGQARLHPELVNRDARALIGVARRFGALGWKVNGAGGEGGSVTILAGPDPARLTALQRAIDETAGWQRLPLRFAPGGVRVTRD